MADTFLEAQDAMNDVARSANVDRLVQSGRVAIFNILSSDAA